MASSDRINYAIRPNKTVERKLVFETLNAIAPIYNFTEYRYIGFGAVWFVDFVLAHKYLSIKDMISIESDEYVASRAKFNKPYMCVRIKHGDSDMILPALPLEEKPLLVWLDYDTSFEGPVLHDLGILCQRAPTGSIALVTINIHKGRLPDKDGNGQEFRCEEEKLRYSSIGYLVPQTLPPGAMQGPKYPGFLATLIFEHINRQIRIAGRENDRAVPLFNISYKDNAPMITVGAAITNEHFSRQTIETLKTRNPSLKMDAMKQLSIRVPPLTLKEKATLDQLMPCDSAPTECAVSKNLGFRLKQPQIEAYHRFYRYYPMFGEVTI